MEKEEKEGSEKGQKRREDRETETKRLKCTRAVTKFKINYTIDIRV